MKKVRKRVLVIGLDGGTLDLIRPWASEGYLPNIARLMSDGCYGHLASTLQPTTAPAWVTFMTGVNQGKHGVYDFVCRRSGEYGLKVTNASQIGAPTLFEMISRWGGHVVSVNVPYTFPPSSINGVMVSGPFAPAVTRDTVFPPGYLDVLQDIVPDYFVLPDHDPRAADPLAAYAEQLLQGIELRERLSLHLLQTELWDLFAVVFMASDEAQHAYWHCQDAPEGTPEAGCRHVIRDVYQRIDRAVGAIVAQCAADGRDRETVVIIMSDHGAGPFRWMLNLNRWLAEAGYLRFRTGRASLLTQLRAAGVKRLALAYRRYVPAKVRMAIRARLGGDRFDRIKGDFESALLTSAIDWPRTKAYALGAGGNIFINLESREPAGIVRAGAEYERVRQKIIDSLGALRDPETDHALVKRVYRREELYEGPFLDRAPDLVVQWADYSVWGRGRYDSRGTSVFEAQQSFDFSELPLSGSHRPRGILMLSGSGVRPGAQIEEARIADLAPTILSVLGLPIPDHVDGRVLDSAFHEGVIRGTRSSSDVSTLSTTDDGSVYTPEEAAKISQRLQDLGYL